MERTREIDGVPRLIGARCERCGHATFPRRERCPACRGPMREEVFGPAAQVENAATLHVSTDEAEAPYSVGMVRVDDGPSLLARIEGAGAGERVELVIDPERDAFWFTASANGSEEAS